MNRLETRQARALQKVMLQAREDFDKAYGKYQGVLAAAMDADAGVASDHAIRWEGRAFATALRRYSDATMAWLIFAENSLHPRDVA